MTPNEAYGVCPECGEYGVSTERRVMGNSKCVNGHSFQRTVIKASPRTAGGSGAGILFHCPESQSFLLLKRGANGDEPGTWCCPGGGVEDYETVEEGARRECEEEMEYSRKNPLQLIHMHRDYQPDTGYTFHNFIAIVPHEFRPILNDEHTDYKWCTMDKFPNDLHPGLARSITAFKQRNGTE